MQVQNNSSQSFNGIRIQTYKMNRVQKAISNSISDALDYLPVYDRACDEALDIYMLPARNNSKSCNRSYYGSAQRYICKR